MTDFASAATDYLATRRALGYQLSQQSQLLTQFAAYLDSVCASHWTALGLMETPEFGISPPVRRSL